MTAGHPEWAALEGAELRAVDEAGVERTLALHSVSPAGDAGGWSSYTLAFRGGVDFPAAQQTYRLTGPGVDELVFLVPVARDAEGIALEAVFAQAPEPQAPGQRHEED